MLTAGAGGMYCGSCLHDNALAAALQRSGVDAILIPTYTPLRTDEANVSIDRIFFGGANVFLQQKLPWLPYLPKFIDRWLDHPAFLRWLASRNLETDPSRLGALTLSMLRGDMGRQKREVEKLCEWLKTVRPSLILFSNMLIAGCTPALKRELGVPIVVTLQGDDVFLEGLPPADRCAVVAQMNQLGGSIDGFVTHSRFYADHMSEYLTLPRDRFNVVPLGINTHDFLAAGEPRRSSSTEGPLVVGYLARLAPEKGLHLLCDAFIELRRQTATRATRLRIAGWSGSQGAAYAEQHLGRVRETCGADSVDFLGEVSREEKVEFLRSLDIFCVPSQYQEPKGLYALEAMAAGLPVVHPAHGAFPELLQATGGGVLFQPHDASSLAGVLSDLLSDAEKRQQLGIAGQKAVHQHHSSEAAAAVTWQNLQRFLA